MPVEASASAFPHQLVGVAPRDWPDEVVRIVAELAGRADGDRDVFCAGLFQLCAQLRRSLGSPGAAQRHRRRAGAELGARGRPGGRSAPVQQAVAMIERHFAEPLTTAGIAKAVGRERSYLATRFRAETGSTIHEFIGTVRLSHATRLVLAGEKVEAAGLAVGYRSKSTLYRWCRTRLGVTPKRLQQAMSADFYCGA